MENPEVFKLLRILKILVGVQIVLGIFTMFISVWSGLMLILGSVVLVLVIWTKNWCTCIVYIILCLMDVLTSIMLVGDYFSSNDASEDDDAILVVLYMLRFPFYLVVMYYTFLSYRELKGVFIDTMQRGFNDYGTVQTWYNRNNAQNNQPVPAPQPQPFTGTGYRLG